MGQPRCKRNTVTTSFGFIMRPIVGFGSACSHGLNEVLTAFKQALSLILVQLSQVICLLAASSKIGMHFWNALKGRNVLDSGLL